MKTIRKVTNDIYWVGGNDKRIALFENIFPIPEGVSYNSYLLVDEKTVLFDAVDWAITREYIENIRQVLGDRKLDYLVVHHMEPDHCGSIEELYLRYPDIKIVASAQGFDIMRQIGYRLNEENFIIVKEGDKMSFGKHEIAFLEAPMVHWPEVLVSLDLTDGVLFSADAFGSFGSIDGKLFADEVNFDRDWLDMARRYYTNIVGKYGAFVQDLLKKAAPLLPQVKYICPLHGLVWRKDFEYLLDKYDKWSKYEPEEAGVLIVFASMYGNTEYAAQCLASELCERGMTNVVVRDVSSVHFSHLIAEAFKFSHIILASVTYNLGIYPMMKNFIHDMEALNVQNRTVGIIENGTWACTVGDKIQDFLDNNMKLMDIMNDRVTINTALNSANENDMDSLADSIIESMKNIEEIKAKSKKK